MSQPSLLRFPRRIAQAKTCPKKRQKIGRKDQKKCYNKRLASTTESAAYGGSPYAAHNIVLLAVVRRIFTGRARG
jgi:hypothetical protein